MTDTTKDMLLGGRFSVRQPRKGYRIAVDTLLLASAVPMCHGEVGLDMGCGVGGVMLAVATRVAGSRIVGLEIQEDMAALCEMNIEDNKLQNRLSVHCGDVACSKEIFFKSFDHVMMNPPYHDGRSHIASQHISKEISHMESMDVDIKIWVSMASTYLKEQGVLTLIHRADRLDNLVNILLPLFGKVLIKPVLSKKDVPAKRVIIRASKAGDRVVETMHPFVLYGEGGKYSDDAETILRGALPMDF